MAGLTELTLKGNWATLLLPINHDESIDYQRLTDEIHLLIQAQVNGIYSNGTAGEFYNQTEDEFDKINNLLADKCRSAGMLFQVGACHMSPLISLERIKRSRHLNPDAYQVILPDWVTTNLEEQIIFLQKLAEAADPIPLVLYHPPHAKTILEPAGFKLLADAIPPLIGVKVAGGDAQWFSDMRQNRQNLAIFVPGHRLATGINAGVAKGSYSNIACLNPRGAQQWYELMQKDMVEALKIEKKILTFFEQYIFPFVHADYSNPALDKLLAAIGNWAPVGTRLRWPHRWIEEQDVIPIRKAARKMLPEIML